MIRYMKWNLVAVFLCIMGAINGVRAESSEYASLPRIIEHADGIICHEGSNEAEVVFDIGFIVTCFYPDEDLLSTYHRYRAEYKKDSVLKLLKETIRPGKNEQTKIAADFIFTYQWKSNQELEIEIFEPGGVTTLEFIQKMSGTTVKSTSSPD